MSEFSGFITQTRKDPAMPSTRDRRISKCTIILILVQFSSRWYICAWEFSSRWYLCAWESPYICTPSCLSGVSPMLPMKQFQCSEMSRFMHRAPGLSDPETGGGGGGRWVGGAGGVWGAVCKIIHKFILYL